MNRIEERLAAVGVKLPEIYLPADNVADDKWSVVACDQFTSEPDYWKATESIVEDSPSALRIILPEAYLENGKTEQKIEKINENMKAYLSGSVLRKIEPGFVLLDRKTAYVDSRKGLMVAIDLENYSFEKGAEAMVRPTEGTVLDRIPPRMNIRRGAALDMPHILLLVNDPSGILIESLYEKIDDMEVLYDFELMQNGGHLKGWKVPDAMNESVAEAFEKLVEDGLLFAVGDGNHSLASAKGLWEEKKAQGVPMDHPARWALVEVENVHDCGLPFHPIHRVLFNVDSDEFMSELSEAMGGSFLSGEMAALQSGNDHSIGVIHSGDRGTFSFSMGEEKLTVEFIQSFLDKYLDENPDTYIDYIHGDDVVTELSTKPGNLGIVLPDVDKGDFFNRIVSVGPYPRKTFSIGEASEKRYYLESRRLSLD